MVQLKAKVSFCLLSFVLFVSLASSGATASLGFSDFNTKTEVDGKQLGFFDSFFSIIGEVGTQTCSSLYTDCRFVTVPDGTTTGHEATHDAQRDIEFNCKYSDGSSSKCLQAPVNIDYQCSGSGEVRTYVARGHTFSTASSLTNCGNSGCSGPYQQISPGETVSQGGLTFKRGLFALNVAPQKPIGNDILVCWTKEPSKNAHWVAKSYQVPNGASVVAPAGAQFNDQLLCNAQLQCSFGSAPAPVCGNKVCEAGETASSCSVDCGGGGPTGPVCGNNICEVGEDLNSCSQDCGSTGGGGGGGSSPTVTSTAITRSDGVADIKLIPMFQTMLYNVVSSGLDSTDFVYVQLWKEGMSTPASNTPNCITGDGSLSWGSQNNAWARTNNGIGTFTTGIPKSIFETNGNGKYFVRAIIKDDVAVGCDTVHATSSTKEFIFQVAGAGGGGGGGGTLPQCSGKPTLIRAEWTDEQGNRIASAGVGDTVRIHAEFQNSNSDCEYTGDFKFEIKKEVPNFFDELLSTREMTDTITNNAQKVFDFDYDVSSGVLHYDVQFEETKYTGSDNQNKHGGGSDYASDDLTVGTGKESDAFTLSKFGFQVNNKDVASVPVSTPFIGYVEAMATKDVTGQIRLELRSDAWLSPDPIKNFEVDDISILQGDVFRIEVPFTASQDSFLHQETYHMNFYLEDADQFGRLPESRNQDLAVITGAVSVQSHTWTDASGSSVETVTELPVIATALFANSGTVDAQIQAKINIRQDVGLFPDKDIRACEQIIQVRAGQTTPYNCSLDGVEAAEYHYEIFINGDKVIERGPSVCVATLPIIGCEDVFKFISNLLNGPTLWFVLIAIAALIIFAIVGGTVARILRFINPPRAAAPAGF